jgi:DNA-binding NarL/FixJ family response regulator
MSKIKVLIADDHALMREGIRALLRTYDDVEVVGEARDGSETLEKAPALTPDVILVDVAMPGLGGLEVTPELRRLCPQAKVLVLTQYDNREYVFRMLRAGAAGYVLKKAAATELVSAIRAVQRGERFLDPSIAAAVIEGYLRKGEQGHTDDAYDSLTDREKQVLKLIAEGNTNKQIAEKLGISVKTAMAHRANIMGKLDVHNRSDLIKFAIRKGLIQVDV